MLLKPQEPFSFAHTLRFLLGPPTPPSGQPFSPLLDYFEEKEYRRVMDADGQLVLYGVREERRGSSPRLRVRILTGPVNEAIQRAARAQVESQFSLALDLNPFYTHYKGAPLLR